MRDYITVYVSSAPFLFNTDFFFLVKDKRFIRNPWLEISFLGISNECTSSSIQYRRSDNSVTITSLCILTIFNYQNRYESNDVYYPSTKDLCIINNAQAALWQKLISFKIILTFSLITKVCRDYYHLVRQDARWVALFQDCKRNGYEHFSSLVLKGSSENNRTSLHRAVLISTSHVVCHVVVSATICIGRGFEVSKKRI